MSKSLRSQLYRAARDLDDVQAARKGPSGIGHRVVRREGLPFREPPAGAGSCGSWVLKSPGVKPV